MSSLNRSRFPSANVISLIMQRDYSLSIYSKNAVNALPAMIVELNRRTGDFVVEAKCLGGAIESYLDNDTLSFDLEALKTSEFVEREILSLNKVSARLLKTDSDTYRFECQLPPTVFVQENRGAMRIPFLLGMHARANIEVYTDTLSISGHLRNISVGGCLVDVTLEESIALTVGQTLPGLTIEFPNGESLHCEGQIKHMRPYGNHGQAAIGIKFSKLSSQQSELLFYFVNESEREAAYRTGLKEKLSEHSQLFIASAKERKMLQHEKLNRQKRAQQSPSLQGVLEVAYQLQVILMVIKNRSNIPSGTVYDCADTLIYLAREDHKALLYALSFLDGQSDWVRSAVQVAGLLANTLLIRDPHSPDVREAVVGALLHTIGKPLLISQQLPNLNAHMQPEQKKLLKGHVNVMLNTLTRLGWQPSRVCRDVLENANELLDGSGYPAGKRGNELSEVVRLISVIKMANKLTHARNGHPPRTPIDAYRWINDMPAAYEKAILIEHIQLYGLYPIGSLAKYAGGFLAWIMDIDIKGMPSKIHVIKNLRFEDAMINSILESRDFSQLGKFEGIVNPAIYGVQLKTN
ncbi:MAG: PilZ domain-containing protein [Gammaproteobacteria bacterium]|nr:PilZ domain-containing protein [Gammaproteobacteria bacterium]